MKEKKTAADSKSDIGIIACILAALMLFLIAFPSFAEDETGAEEMPDTETVIVTDENAGETCEDTEESGTETVPEGYLTMKTVSGNAFVTN